MKGDLYRCAMCGKEYQKTRTEKETMKEYHRDFPGASDEEREVVCDDCWKKMTRKIPPPGRKKRKWLRLKIKPGFLPRLFPLLHPRRYREINRWLRETENAVMKEWMDNLLYGKTK